MSVAEYEQVAALAKNLSDLDKIRLVEEVMETFKQKLTQGQVEEMPRNRPSFYGIWEGVSVSEEDIDEIRREMWSNFPREDI